MDHLLVKARIIITAVILCVMHVAYGQCSGCTGNVSLGVPSYTVNPGQTLCLGSGMTYNGTIVINGGTFCNAGTVKTITFLSGTFRNYGTYNAESNVNISPNGNITIENFHKSNFSVTGFAFNGSASRGLTFNSYKGSRTTFGSFAHNSGNVAMVIGKNNPESDPDPTSFLTVNGLFTSKADLTLTMQQNSTGSLNDVVSLEGTGIKTITNYGDLDLSGDLKMASAGSVGSIVTINNYSEWRMKSLTANYTAGKVFINNYQDPYYVAQGMNNIFNIATDLVLLANTAILSNTGNAEISGTYRMSGGATNNSGYMIAGSFMITGGTLKNDNYLKATGDYANTNSATTINNKSFIVGNSFNNTAIVTLAAESFIYTKNYYNTGSGASITGATSDIVTSLFPRIVIKEHSENSAYLKERIFIYDVSIISDVTTIGYGFDVLSNPDFIGPNIFFPIISAAPGTGNPPLVSCASLTAMHKINVSPDMVVPCGPVYPQAQAIQTFPNSTVTETLTIPASSYTWQPGGSNGSTPTLYPTATTVYTVYATLSNGCVISNTFQVTVTTPAPTIQYNGITPYAPGSTLTFPVTMNNPIAGGTYSATPTGLNINPSTGVISASGSAFGTYTVTYKIPEGSGCYWNYPITTVVTLTNIQAQCNNIEVGFAGGVIEPYLCPGEKIQMLLTGTATSYTWSPATGLSCANCANPLLTYTPSVGVYTVTYTMNNYVCPPRYLSVFEKDDCDKETIIGCCFSNYGVAVNVSGASTYLNVYCNVLNEVANLTLPTTFSKGKFESTGHITVSKDWYHNGQNKLFEIPYALSQNSLAVPQGTTSFIANTDQHIKGNSSTYFNKLILAGNGKRLIWIDTYSTSDLDLTSNEFVLQNFNFLMKNGQANVFRTSGFASSQNDGYFSRLLASNVSAPNKTYLFPLGSAATAAVPYRYRPLEMMNNKSSVSDEISANFTNDIPTLADPAFVNVNPQVTNFTGVTSPNVLQVNYLYYHKVKNTQASAPLSNIVLRHYFPAIDGNFNSISEWEAPTPPGPDWWGIVPGAFSNYAISTNPGTFGQVYAAANGTLSFQGTPFALATTAVNINTSSFGPGNVITLSSSPSTGTTVGTSTTTTNNNPVVNTTTTTVLGLGVTTSTVSSSNGSGSTNTVVVTSGVTTGTIVNTGPPSVVTYTTSTGPGGITTNTTVTVTGTLVTVTTSSTAPTIGGASSSTITVVNGSTTTTSVSITTNNGNSSTTVTTFTISGPGGTSVQTQTCVTTTNGATQVTTCTGAGAGTYTTTTTGPNIPPVNTYTNVYNPGPIVTAPNPLASDYYLNIASLNSCDLPGKVKFSVSPNSTIDPNSVEFYDPVTNTPLGNLSPSLFTITTPTLGITLNATPTEILAACSNSIIVTTSSQNDHVISSISDALSVNIPYIPGGSVSYFTIYNYSNVQQGSPQALYVSTNNPISTNALAAGVYHFEFTITIGANNHTVKGQFIKSY